MLKVFLGFVVSVVVLLSSAYVSPTYATSANVLITQIQAGGIGAATQEFIIIYNNSPEDIDISGWCLTNKNAATIACFSGPTGQAVYLPAYKHAVVASTSLAITLPVGTVTTTYVPISQSSGSITGSAETVSLIDHMGAIVDRQAWTTPLSTGMQFERYGVGSPIIYQDTDSLADWSITLPGVLPIDETYIDMTIVDVCPNIEGVQPTLPSGKELDSAGDCVDQVTVQLELTEILPNATGSDEGHEFIEIYNPNNALVNLADYRLYIGLNNEDMYDFPDGSVIQPHSYLAFSNSDIPFTLLNTSSLVLLALQDGTVVSQVPAYTNPKDSQSWGIINGIWQYFAQPTPGMANVIEEDLAETEGPDSTPQPCAANQYRNIETNRCRLISSGTSAPTPCKDGQYRSEETNRCRNIATDAATVTPCDADETRSPDTNRCRKVVTPTASAACKEGQERNPDTNRCRTITKMPSADYGVLGAETKGGGNWYIFAAVGGVLLLAVMYAVWEWHEELGKFFRMLLQRARQFVRMRK